VSVEPAIAGRVAKLLRLACCETAPDGEKLAALNRLSATVAAHDLDWDQALVNGGNGSALTEEQMRRIYDEGYQRGHADGQQAARPARDWTPADNTKAEVGSDAQRLETILNAAAQSRDAGLLSDWEVQSRTIRASGSRDGAAVFMSAKSNGTRLID
jgi:hypothetical protein